MVGKGGEVFAHAVLYGDGQEVEMEGGVALHVEQQMGQGEGVLAAAEPQQHLVPFPDQPVPGVGPPGDPEKPFAQNGSWKFSAQAVFSILSSMARRKAALSLALDLRNSSKLNPASMSAVSLMARRTKKGTSRHLAV